MFRTKDIETILETMYPLRSELVPCLIGAPGIGKTQNIYQFAEKHGVKVVTFILSNALPSEVSGIRMPDAENKTLTTFDDERMASLEDGDVLFFDELLEAPPMLWSAILTLIQDRIMASGRKLPDVFIVAASNPLPNPTIVPASVRDRFQWIELEFDYESWSQWFTDKYHVLLPRTVKAILKSDAPGYNILTPRKFVKLYEYWSSDEAAKPIVETMMPGLKDIMYDIRVDRQQISNEFVCKVLSDEGFEIPEHWKTTSLSVLIDEIKHAAGSKAMEEALKRVEV